MEPPRKRPRLAKNVVTKVTDNDSDTRARDSYCKTVSMLSEDTDDVNHTPTRESSTKVSVQVLQDHDYLAILPDGKEQPEGILKHIRELDRNTTLQSRVDKLEQRIPTVSSLKDNDADFSAATGLPNHAVFMALLEYLRPRKKVKRPVAYASGEESRPSGGCVKVDTI